MAGDYMIVLDDIFESTSSNFYQLFIFHGLFNGTLSQ